MLYKYDPINKILVKTKDKSWTDVYKEFEKIVNKYLPNEKKIEAEVEKLYRQHKGDPAWEEAYRRWSTTSVEDSKTVDYSYQDAARTFAYLDKEVQRDLKNYAATIQKADTSKKCEELEQIIRDLMEDYMDEYLDIWNQVGQYAQDKRKQTQQLFSMLMSQCFKKYNELKREGK